MRRTENAGQKDCAQMWFGPDFRGSLKVQAMSWAEQGMYRHLLDLAWENGGIPSDLEDVRGILRLSPEEFAAAWKRIGRCFEPHPDDPSRLVNVRQEREREIRAEIRAERSRNGRKGNAARWGNGGNGVADASHSDRNQIAERSQPDRNPIANPVAKNRPSPPPPPSPSRMQVPLGPAGPGVPTPSSCCGPGEQRDDRPEGSGPAGPSGTSGTDGDIAERRRLFEALRRTTFREHAKHRDAALMAAADRLLAAGIGEPDLVTLAKRAATRRGVKNRASLFAHWIDHPDEALKELGKR